MKNIFRIFLSILFLFTVSAEAQTFTKPEKAIQTMPFSGRAVENFVPKGWEIINRADGDLNGDGLTDAALAIGLTEDMKEMLDTSEDNFESPPYIIVVLLGKEGGLYQRFAANGRLYPKYADAAPVLEIKRDVLVTNQNFRDGWALDVTFRFRYDAALNKMVLIGSDIENYNRADIYAGNKRSENYLTGMRIEYAKSAAGRKSSAYSETKKAQIERSKTALEDVVFDYEEQTFARAARPASAQAKKGFSGSWTWRSAPNKKKEQVGFWVDIKQNANRATGSIWFNLLVDGEAGETDSSAIPFIGTIKGDTLTIEFDPNDIRSIEENIRYRKPKGKPNTAILQLKDGRLEWNQTYGSLNVGLPIPKQMILRRED